jgi:selenocysteine lyase/cysteine desulfurase
MIDLSDVRSRFPALTREQGGRTVVFADAPGGSHVPETVIEAIGGYLRSSNARISRRLRDEPGDRPLDRGGAPGSGGPVARR